MVSLRRTVVKVLDGDTVIVNRKIGKTNRVRLAGVNAPELYEGGGIKARNRLKRLVEGKKVTIVPVGRSYGRIVGKVGRRKR